MGRSAGWTWVPSLARAPRGSGHGDRDLAGVWAAGAGGTPWLCAPLPTSHEVPCLPSPGVPARAGLGGVGAAVPCLSFLRASCGYARWPRGAGCWPSVARHCPARRGVLRWHRSQSCSGGTGSPSTPPERIGAATMGKRRHDAAPEGGGGSCRSPPRQWEPPAHVGPCAVGGFWSAVRVWEGYVGLDCAWHLPRWAQGGLTWPCESCGSQMGVSGFWGPSALVLAGRRHRVLGRMPRGEQAVPGGLSPVVGGM